MKVIGHDHKCVKLSAGKPTRKGEPRLLDDAAGGAKNDRGIDDLA